MAAPRIVDFVDHEARADIAKHVALDDERWERIKEDVGDIKSAQMQDRKDFADYRKEVRQDQKRLTSYVLAMLISVVLGGLTWAGTQVWDRVMHAQAAGAAQP